MLRKIFFWAHLVAGISAGLVILMMSVTGTLLTYERQLLAWSANNQYEEPADISETLPIDTLIEKARQLNPEFKPDSIIFKQNNGAPVVLQAGRTGSIRLNPYTGEEVAGASPAMEHFFRTITAWHRWFAAEGENRAAARAITGASNLIFLFLILSGIYLWLPALYKWGMFKARLLFRRAYPDSKARDFNWHHVLGFWTAIPLAIVVATATVFSYGWANNLVYRSFGEEPPVRGRGPGPQVGQSTEPVIIENQSLSITALTELAFRYAQEENSDWQQLSLSLPDPLSSTASISIDSGNGAQPHLRKTLTVDTTSGEIVSSQEFSDQSPGQRTRFIIRYLHTGEVLGLWGQTIAGLVSLTSVFMVWTGFALAWRRLVSPLFKRRLN